MSAIDPVQGLMPGSTPIAALRARGGRRRDHGGLAFTVLAGFAALLIVAMVVVILGDVVWNGARTVTWEFIAGVPREGMTKGGIFPAIYGTLLLVVLMVIALVPFGVGAAIWLHLYARQNSWFTRTVRFAVHNLAGVPSIVYGLFGLGFFIQFIGHQTDRFLGLEVVWGQPALLWAALTLALLNLPVVIVTTEEALGTVPRDQREASLALGATRWQTVKHVLLPQALPGILTGAILAVARGAGEVAPILFTGRGLLSAVPAQVADRPVHGARLSCVRAGDAVPGRRRDATAALWHGARAVGADLPVEPDRDPAARASARALAGERLT
jgi:phosphate transport system permease protein